MTKEMKMFMYDFFKVAITIIIVIIIETYRIG